MAGLIISPRARIFQGHDWVYGTEVRKVFGNPQPGDVVALKDFKDRFLGSAMFNPHSQIVARRFSRRKQELDELRAKVLKLDERRAAAEKEAAASGCRRKRSRASSGASLTASPA